MFLRKIMAILCFLLLTLGTSEIFGQIKALRFGKLVDGHGKVFQDAVVIIEADKIVSVGTGNVKIPANAQVIDLGNYTAIPGMIDAHTHMTYYWDKTPGTRPWTQQGTLGPVVTVFLAQENARKTLETGVTTVRDLGSSNYTDIAMRDLIKRGAMPGPRMFVAGYGLTISRAAPTPGSQPRPGQADGVQEVQRIARQQLGAGADWIKMYGSTGSDQNVTGFQTFTYEEIKAAVDVAHFAGKKLAIHTYGPDAARDAVKAGVNTIEHATDMDDATIAEMARLNIIYVPTVDHNRYYIAHSAEFGYDSAVINRLNGFINRNFATLKKAIKAGVEIAMGSDAVFTGFGENTRELSWFVKGGMTPEQALMTATKNGAEMLGMEKSLGAIAPGYFADIVAVEGDPIKDINVVINNVKWVMKGGKVEVDITGNTKK